MDVKKEASTTYRTASATDVLWNSVGSLVYLGCTWLTTVLVVLLSDDYQASGSLAIAMAVGNVFSTIALFRVRTVQISDVRHSFSTGEYVAARLFTILIGFAATSIYALFTVDPSAYAVVALYVLYKAIESYVDVFHGVDQCHFRFDVIGKSQIYRGVASLAGFLVGMALFHSLVVAIALMAVLTGLILCLFDCRCARDLEEIEVQWPVSTIARLLSSCVPGFIAMLCVTLVVSLTRQRYGLLYGQNALGVYAAIAAPTVIVQALASYIYAPLVVPLAEAYHAGKSAVVLRTVGKFLLALGVLIAASEICCWLFGFSVLNVLLGGISRDAVDLAYPLLICTGATALLYFLQDMLIVMNMRLENVACGAIALVGSLVASDSLFGAFGANGITYSILLGYGLNILISLLLVAHACGNRRHEI